MGNSCSNEESVNVEQSPASVERKVKKRDPDKKQRVRIKENPDEIGTSDQTGMTLDIPTVQFLPTTKPTSTDQNPTNEAEQQQLRHLSHLNGNSSYSSSDHYEMAPKIRRHYIAPMSEEEWNKRPERDTITIVQSSPTTENGSAYQPWYK